MLLKWDKDSPVSFKANGHTVHDFERRFQMESQAKVPFDRTFKWGMIMEDNSMTKRIHTAESVTCGHPDKLADLIADSILDECLHQDENSRVACEVMLAHNKCFISGEITTKAKVDYVAVAKSVIADVGYDAESVEYETRIHEQAVILPRRLAEKNKVQATRVLYMVMLCKKPKTLCLFLSNLLTN